MSTDYSTGLLMPWSPGAPCPPPIREFRLDTRFRTPTHGSAAPTARSSSRCSACVTPPGVGERCSRWPTTGGAWSATMTSRTSGFPSPPRVNPPGPRCRGSAKAPEPRPGPWPVLPQSYSEKPPTVGRQTLARAAALWVASGQRSPPKEIHAPHHCRNRERRPDRDPLRGPRQRPAGRADPRLPAERELVGAPGARAARGAATA